MRNDIYVTLLQGEFDRGKKKTPKNVEVILSVHDDEGNPMEVKKINKKKTRTYNKLSVFFLMSSNVTKCATIFQPNVTCEIYIPKTTSLRMLHT